MTFAELLPNLRPWVQNLINVWPAYIVKPNFAVWEVFHILSLVLLGGCTILIGLRLVGAGLTEEPPSVVYRNLKNWLLLGVVGIVVSGVCIGMANAERLYDSAAFLVKMFSLLSAVIFTYGVMRPTALADGVMSPTVKVTAVVALVAWGLGLWVFLTGGLIMPGLFHLLSAAVLIVLFALRGTARLVYAVGVGLILLAMYLATHVFIAQDDLAKSDPANLTLAWLMTAWVAGAAVWQVTRGRKAAVTGDRATGVLTQAVGYAVILMWVTAGAAGRWIAFA